MTITRDNFLSALEPCCAIAARRTSLPILNCVKLSAMPEGMLVHATDLTCYLRERVDVIDGSLQPICVPAKRLLDVVRSLGDEITMEHKNGRLLLSGGGEAELSTLPEKDFPPENTAALKPQGVPVGDLADCLEAVGDYASDDPAQQLWKQSVQIEGANKKLRVQAANGPTIAVMERLIICARFECIIPKEAARSIASALRREDAQFVLGEAHAGVTHKGGAFLCQLPEGKYANTAPILSPKRTRLGELSAEGVEKLLASATLCDGFSTEKLFIAVTLGFNKSEVWIALDGRENSYHRRIAGEFACHKTQVNSFQLTKVLQSFREPSFKGNPVMISTNTQATLVFEAGDLTVCLATLKDKEVKA